MESKVGEPPEKPFALEDYTELMSALEEQANSEQAFPENLESQITPFFKDWGTQDGLAAVTFCQTLAEGQITPTTMAALNGWAQQDLAGAVTWAINYETDGHEKVLYLAQLATGLKPEQTDQVAPLADAWGAIDPAAASQWLFGLGASPVTNPSLQTSVIAWTKASPEEVSTFLATAPKGAARDTAIAAMIEVIAQDDPAAAEKWGKELSREQVPLAP